MDLSAYKNFLLSPLKFFRRSPKKIPVRSIKGNNIPLPNKQRPAAKVIPPRKRYDPYHRFSAAQSIRLRRSQRLSTAGLYRSRRKTFESIREDARRVLKETPNPRDADLIADDFMEQLLQDKKIMMFNAGVMEEIEEQKDLTDRAERDQVFRADETLDERRARRAREKALQDFMEEQERQRVAAVAKKQEQERLQKLEEERLRKLVEETRKQKFFYPEAGTSRQQEELNARKKRMEEQARAAQNGKTFFTSKLEDQFPRRGPKPGRVNGLGPEANAFRRELSFKRRMDFIRRDFEKRAAQRAKDKPWVPKGRDLPAERLQRNGIFKEDLPKPPPPPQPKFQQFPRPQPEAYFHPHNFPQPQPQANFQQSPRRQPPPQAYHRPPPPPKQQQAPPKPKFQPPPQPPPQAPPPPQAAPPQPNVNQNAQAPPAPTQLTVAGRYERYEQKWEALKAGKYEDKPIPVIFFGFFPWPVLCDVLQVEDITEQRVAEFLFHPDRPGFQGKSRRDRIRKEIIRWHPDKFESKMLDYIAPEHRELVQKVAGEIARFLTREAAKN